QAREACKQLSPEVGEWIINELETFEEVMHLNDPERFGQDIVEKMDAMSLEERRLRVKQFVEKVVVDEQGAYVVAAIPGMAGRLPTDEGVRPHRARAMPARRRSSPAGQPAPGLRHRRLRHDNLARTLH